jgi:hypothetical protein
MPRIRIDLNSQSFEALTRRAAAERRPIDLQAEVLIERALGVRTPEQRSPDDQDCEELAREVAHVSA